MRVDYKILTGWFSLDSKKQEKQSLVSVVADLRHASLPTTRFIAETLILLEVWLWQGAVCGAAVNRYMRVTHFQWFVHYTSTTCRKFHLDFHIDGPNNGWFLCDYRTGYWTLKCCLFTWIKVDHQCMSTNSSPLSSLLPCRAAYHAACTTSLWPCPPTSHVLSTHYSDPDSSLFKALSNLQAFKSIITGLFLQRVSVL